MRARLALAATLALCGAGVLAGTGAAAGGGGDAPAPPARAAAVRTVKVADNFFAPKRLTVARGTTIRWRWSNANADSHDVYLAKRPKGVRRFHSPPAATFFTYKRKLRKAGTYRMICTFHEGMTMRVVVRRR